MATTPSSTDSSSPRYEVRVREHHGGGLYELEITVWHEVFDTSTGALVMRFEGGSSASYDGSGWSDWTSGGVRSVELVPEGDAVLVHYAGGRSERVVIPGAA